MDFQSFLRLLASDLAAAEEKIRANHALLGLRSRGMEETAVHYFVIEDARNIVCMLLRHGAPVNATNSAQQSPLMNAAQLNNALMIVLLLERGADYSLEDENGDTALHVAVEGGCMQAATALIEAGADVAEPNGCGMGLEELVPQDKLIELERLLRARAAAAKP
jgi:hypothetical protein